MSVGTNVPLYICKVRDNLRSRFFPSTIQDPGIKLRSLGLMADTFAYRVTLLAYELRFHVSGEFNVIVGIKHTKKRTIYSNLLRMGSDLRLVFFYSVLPAVVKSH